ncbi:MAG: hypothetical protein JSS50_00110 [Proteobacteria bacterium]|nr:hypothetical protein [Pseudomonadota bacterium]
MRTLKDYKKLYVARGNMLEQDNLKTLWREIYYGFEWFTPLAAKIWSTSEERSRPNVLRYVGIFFSNIDEVLDIAVLELKEMAKDGVSKNSRLSMLDINNKQDVPDVIVSDFMEIGPIFFSRCPALILISKIAQELEKKDAEKTPQIKQLEKSLGAQRVSKIKLYGQIKNSIGEKSQEGARQILTKDKVVETSEVSGWRGPAVFRRKITEKAEKNAALNKEVPQTKDQSMRTNIRAASEVATKVMLDEINKMARDPHLLPDLPKSIEKAILSGMDTTIDSQMLMFAEGLQPKSEEGPKGAPVASYLQTLEMQSYCLDLNPQREDGRFYDNTINGKFYQKEFQLMRQFCVDIGGKQHADVEMKDSGRGTYLLFIKQFFQAQIKTPFHMTLSTAAHELNATRDEALPRLTPLLLDVIHQKLDDTTLSQQDRQVLIRMADFIFDYRILLEETQLEMLQRLHDHKLAMLLVSSENGKRAGFAYKSYAPVEEGHPKLEELQQIINKRRALLAVRKAYCLYGQHARNEELKKSIPLAIAFLVGALAIDVGVAAGTSYITGEIAGEAVSKEAIEAMHDMLNNNFDTFIAACNNGNPITIALAVCAIIGVIGPIIAAFFGAELSGHFGDNKEAIKVFSNCIKQEIPDINIVAK